MHMDVVEAPRLWGKSAPSGAVVLVTMDPVASVAALRDADATAAAERLARPTFLGYIYSPADVDWSKPPNLQPLSLRINFVMRCLPDPPFTFVPLSFDAALQHPSGRLPVIPSRPLPWPDCFLYTKDQLVVRVSRIFLTEQTKICQLSKEQQGIVRKAFVYDIQHGGAITSAFAASVGAAIARHAAHSSARESEHVDQTRQPLASEYSLRGEDRQSSPSTSRDILGDVPQQKVPLTKANLLRNDAESASPDDSSGTGETASDDESEEPRELKSSAEIQLDLSFADEISTVDDYGRYMASLRKIEEDWNERTLFRELAHQPATERWAADVAAAVAAGLDNEGDTNDISPASVSRRDPADEGLGEAGDTAGGLASRPQAPNDPNASAVPQGGNIDPGAKRTILDALSKSVTKGFKRAIAFARKVVRRVFPPIVSRRVKAH